MTDQFVTDVPFAPDWVSPPGDTILDLMNGREWTQAELAERLGFSLKHVNQLIKGKVALTEDAAIRLQSVLGSSVEFWLKREAQYRERAAMLEAQQRHAGMIGWLDQLPVKDLMKLGVIENRRIDANSKPRLVTEMLAFFGVATPEQWQSHYGSMEVCFRRSRAEQSDIGAISAWLRMGEQTAEKLDGPYYDESRFKAALQEIRALTILSPQEFQPRLMQSLHQAGVALVLVPALPGAGVSGVARWLNAHRPLIQLSLYGKSNDRFWFTLFHEVAHILLHGKEKKAVFLDDPGNGESDSPQEKEANAWARDFLIPRDRASMLEEMPKTKVMVKALAAELGIHSGIVVGRLQYEGLIPMKWMNDLKDSFRFQHLSK
ncbi:MAG: ImmA/IrrE family metallo-endopeptidase [Thiothrix sp.]|nr:ImmA/IrrE family metallo-endopeptidase [Thiothrix sp.]HPQ94625.1 ImmA/IrrE family metallo-endopeptidase [Thiolinea sp.]